MQCLFCLTADVLEYDIFKEILLGYFPGDPASKFILTDQHMTLPCISGMGELAAHQEDGTMPISCDETKNEEGKGNDVTDESFPVPPDGGWGWVVCLGCFMAMVMLDGVMFTFGVFFLELQSYFGESKGRTALVGSALMGSSLMMGEYHLP